MIAKILTNVLKTVIIVTLCPPVKIQLDRLNAPVVLDGKEMELHVHRIYVPCVTLWQLAIMTNAFAQRDLTVVA